MSRSAATRAKAKVVIVIAAAAYLIGEWTIIVPESKILEIKLFLRSCYTLESEKRELYRTREIISKLKTKLEYDWLASAHG
jgi:hypothetical protein